ncbi:MAG: Cof-type HAD-IIB family hydrolase [Myxococcota bacterium]|nr:Cof-type HAD-IIB family hydrolase [Myxococcota bacterium]
MNHNGMRHRLLAIDLDGTLLRDDRTVAPEDIAAIREARSAGIHVTLVTGRIASGALPTAREVGIETPIVCADGGQLVHPATGELIARKSLPGKATRAALGVFSGRKLTPFVLTHEAIHARRGSESLAPWVVSWSPDLRLHSAEEPSWPQLRDVAIVLGIGARDLAGEALDALGSSLPPSAGAVSFPMGSDDVWGVRVQARGCTKSVGLSALAARLGVRRTDVAYVGDWYNDLSAFAWAGRSFCMGHAPQDVKRHASEVLRSTGANGGGVAEVLQRWM